VDFSYGDCSGLTAPVRPLNATYSLIGGSDGGTVIDADYIGSDEGIGIRALDGFEDFMDFVILDNFNSDVQDALAIYVEGRKDFQTYMHLELTNDTAASLVAARAALTVDTSYVDISSGGIKVIDPETSERISLPEIADVVGLRVATDLKVAPWFAAAGLINGLVPDALGVVNNFGASGVFNDLNYLANRQVNMMVHRGGKTVYWGNHSAQIAQSHMSQSSVRRFVIWLKKVLKPACERYLYQPNDPVSWKALYFEVKPLLDTLKGPGTGGRALYDYLWQGDQFANQDLSNLTINSAVNVGLGKYKIKLKLVIIPGILEIELEIGISPTGVTFNETIL
jgi:phage tail sheath protein FI